MVPVFEGTDEWTLNRGAPAGSRERHGRARRVATSASRGHLDSFFRILKDIRDGDVMELISAARTATYTVSRVEYRGSR